MKLEGPATSLNLDIPVEPSPKAEPVYDYSQFVDEPKSDGELATLANLAEQGRAAEYQVEMLQRQLKKAQDAYKEIVERKIPELMEQVGMEKFATSGGLNIAIRETIRASMGTGPAKDRNLDWLEQQGHDAIIKMGVEVPFGRGDEEQAKAKELADYLRQQGYPAQFARKVEPSTLSALIRELLEEGRPVPEEQFGVFRQRVAKIT